MTPLKLFYYLLASAGGIGAIGITLIALLCIWLYFTGGNANKGGT